VSISSVAPSANSSGAAALSDAGIGSGLNVDGIVSKLMQVESLPLTQLNSQISSYQATLSDYGTVTSAISAFQSAVQSLNTAAQSTALSVTPSNTSVLTGTATSTATAGNYNINVSQLAQAQTLTAAGVASTSAAIGNGASTTISFQFGTIGAGITGSTLAASVASSGIAAGSLTINGTAIATGSNTTSAQQLAAQINQATGTTGVTATAQASNSGTVSFTPVATGDGDSYTLQVGNTVIANVGADSSCSASDLDAALQSTGAGSVGAQLAADGVTFTGTAEDGTLQFSKADGSNLTISQTLTNSSGNASGGIDGLSTSGATQTYLGGVSLSATGPVTIGGTSPTTAGLTAGSSLNSGIYSNGSFTPNSSLAGGSVTITSANNSLQGIVSAINSANLGVTASIINDGSATPYRLVLTSSTTGAAGSMKISVQGDSAISNLLSDDPGGTQNLTQSVAAQNTNLTVNGIPITSNNNTISGAIPGVTLNVAATGSTSVSVAQNSSTLQSAVSSFVTAYNTLNSTLSSATAYNAQNQTAGPLIGDSGVETVQQGLRQVLDNIVPGLSQNLNSLAQLGITFQNDGSLALNSTTLQNAINTNASGVAALFGAVGNSTDNLVGYKTATSATKPGTYAVNITQLATQGTQTGSAAPNLTITTGQNDSLSVDVDGINAQLTIPAGNYTTTSLASEVQSLINGNTAISNAGSSVGITTNSSGALVVTSKRYGSASQVNLTGNAASDLLGSNATQQTGLDVQGTIGGNPATGSGQVLTGLAGSPTAGLALSITGGATGARGTVTYSQGFSNQLSTLLTSYLGSTGPITNESNALNSNISSIQAQITTMNQTLAAQQANYLAEFEALDTTVASLNATQTFLTQQLASLASNG
jgi:flagellar hook-associated protein 2